MSALIQARVDPKTRELVHQCSADAGLSISRYIESLIQADAAARGIAPLPAELETEQQQLDVEKRAS